jgi:hypothetical protein
MTDDIDYIRQFRAGVYEPSPEVREHARQQLAEAMLREQLDHKTGWPLNGKRHWRQRSVGLSGRIGTRVAHTRGRSVLVTAVIMLLAVTGISYVVAGAPGRKIGHSSAAGSTIHLAGYTTHLPSGYEVAASRAADCQIYPGGFTVPLQPDAIYLPMEENATYAIVTPTATVCFGSLLTASYGSRNNSALSVDPVAPSTTTTRVNVGPYRARIGKAGTFAGMISCQNVQGEPPCAVQPSSAGQGAFGLWVQIPSIGGGYHDLVVGSLGLTQTQLIAIVQSALPEHPVAALAGMPPWTIIPPCTAGEAPDPNPDATQACEPLPGT